MAAKLAAKKRSHKRAASQTHGPTGCPKGSIKRDAAMRKSYTRGDGTRVAATAVPSACVPATGRAKSSGHKRRGGPLFILDEGVLAKYGYENVKSLSAATRHTALDKALKAGIKPLPLFRRINALYVLNERKDPHLAGIFRADRAYVKSTPEYARRPTAAKK